MEQISNKKTKARKEHICDTCGSKIYINEEYDLQTNKFDGQIYNWKQCNHCKDIISRMSNEGDYPDGITDQAFSDFVSDNDIDFKRR